MVYENLSKEAKTNAIINYVRKFGAFPEIRTVAEAFEDLQDSCDYVVDREGYIHDVESLYTLHDMKTLEPLHYAQAILAATREADRMAKELDYIDDDAIRYWECENVADLEGFCFVESIYFDRCGDIIYV